MLFNRARHWVRSLALRSSVEREMFDEMAEHLDQATARFEARGLSATDARRAALREFGNVAFLQEEARDARGTGWVDSLVADSRFALRHFSRKAITTLTMVVVLVSGLAISTLLFAFVHAYAYGPPPGVTLEDDLVRIRGSRTYVGLDRGFRTFGEDEFLGYRKLTAQFTAVAGWTDVMTTFTTLGTDRQRLDARISFVTENYFSTLGIRPAIGAGLPTVAEATSNSVIAVIGHAVWEQVFARSPGAIGSTLIVHDIPVTIVGVAPEKFVGFPGSPRFQVWMPLESRRVLFPGPMGEFRAVARLRPGVTMSAASAATQAVAARTAEQDENVRELHPASDVVPLYSTNSDPMNERDVKLMAVSVGLLAMLVLLVTCTNVSALLTGLATARRQEIAIRLSLGAARGRLMRQLLTESAILGIGSGAAALGLVWAIFRAVDSFIAGMPFALSLSIPVVAFTFGVALSVGVLFGLSPALHATRLGLSSVLRDSSGAASAVRGRLQRGLVVAQIAFTQPLIVLLAAVLMLVLGEFLPRARPAFADRLVTASFQMWGPSSGASADAVKSKEINRVLVGRLKVRLQAAPGVEAVVAQWGSAWSVGRYVVHPGDRVAGNTEYATGLLAEHVSSGYFRVMGIPVVRGREFAENEVALKSQRVSDANIVVGVDLARRMWGGADPIGRRLQALGDSAHGARTLTVVGVIDDPKAKLRKAGDDFRIFMAPDTLEMPGLIVRTTASAQMLLPALRDIAQLEIPNAQTRLRTIAEIEDMHMRNFRLVTSGLVAAGAAALLLSAIGLYAVVAFSVGQRTREIAVRMAIGARGPQIVRKFVRDGLRLSAIGLALGLPASLIGLSVLINAVPDIPAVPIPWVTAIAGVGVVVVATIAAWLPARRAAAIDPAVTLRSE